jgi:hypothetical protein
MTQMSGKTSPVRHLGRYLSPLLLVVASLSTFPHAPALAASFPLADDFESAPAGSPPPGWQQLPSPGPFLVTDQDARSHLHSLSAAPRPGKPLLFTTFPTQTSPLLLQFYVKLPADAALSFGLSLGDPSLPTNRAVQITLQKDHYVTYFNGESPETIAPFQSDQWIKVALIGDPSIAAFDLYLSSHKVNAAPLLFWNVLPRLDTLYFELPAEVTTPPFIDRVLLDRSPAPPVPTGLTAAITPNAITLRWNPSRFQTLTAYRLYRAGQFLAELGPTQTSYTDTAFKPAQGYAYSLTALDGPLHRDESLASWPVAALLPPEKPLQQGSKNKYDIVIFGATPAGIAAAIAAARLGSSVALVEPTTHLGGMMSGGLGRTDLRNRSYYGGIFREFIERISAFYRSAYGPKSRQAVNSSSGYFFEPGVARAVFQHMLAEQSGIETYLQYNLSAVRTRRTTPSPANAPPDTSVVSITIQPSPTGKAKTLYAGTFIDASYESDLAALAGAPCRLGREGRQDFNEEHAGEIFWNYVTYQVYPGGSGARDRRIQAYNYRLCLTRRPGNKAPVPRPRGYDPKTYNTVVLDVQERHLHLNEILSLGRLPNDKFDTNNHGYARLSTDLPEANSSYPEDDAAARSRFCRQSKDYILGLLYFLQHDPRLPPQFRAEACQWGLAKDEFTDSGNFPPQIYVREARRIIGLYTFTENDARPDPSLGRTTPKPDSIACGDYAMDSHATQNWNPQTPDYYEGFFYLPYITKPYEIPYRILVPESVERLLVVFGVSATHVGYGTIRMEPVLMELGQAAGTAATLASQRRRWPKNVPIDLLQHTLLESGQVIQF